MKNEYQAPEVKTLGAASESTKNGDRPDFDSQVDDTPAFGRS